MTLRAAILAATLVLGGCAAGLGESVEIPPQQVGGARTAPKPIPARLYLPAGAGPFPAVILLHGCGGIGSPLAAYGGASQLDQWAGRVTGWGYAALVPDSFFPRSVSSVCPAADQPKVTPADRAGDVIGAALWLRGRKEIDGAHIGVIGFSHGGATAERVGIAPPARQFPGLIRIVVNYYGPCLNPERYAGTPMLALSGEADDWGNPATTCHRFADRLGYDKPIYVTTYPGVVHAFDNPALDRRITNQGHALQYDATAAADSIRRTREFLDRYLK